MMHNGLTLKVINDKSTTYGRVLMKVKDLITELQNLDPEDVVFVWSGRIDAPVRLSGVYDHYKFRIEGEREGILLD